MSDSFLGTPSEIWQDAFSKFAAICRMAPWSWFGEGQSFSIHPSGYAEPFFVHPAAGRYGCGEKGLAIVYGWNSNALWCGLDAYRQTPHFATRLMEVIVVIATMRQVKNLSETEKETARAFAQLPDDPEAEAPVFVSFRPGWMPWHLSRVEVESTAKVLNQALGVFLRAEEDISLIERTNPEKIWVRRQGNVGGWEEGWAVPPRFVEFGSRRAAEIDEKLLGQAEALPDTMPPISIDFDIIPQIALLNREAITLRGEDGRIPMGYFFAIQLFREGAKPSIDALESGVFYPASDIGSLAKFFNGIFLKFLVKSGQRPKEVVVSSERMRGFLRPIQMRLPFKIVFHGALPSYALLLKMVTAAVEKNRKTD